MYVFFEPLMNQLIILTASDYARGSSENYFPKVTHLL